MNDKSINEYINNCSKCPLKNSCSIYNIYLGPFNVNPNLFPVLGIKYAIGLLPLLKFNVSNNTTILNNNAKFLKTDKENPSKPGGNRNM